MPHFIIFSVLFLCALVVSCVLTSCQPLVQPFRPEDKTPSAALFELRDAGGIVVRRVEGVPEAGASALVTALIADLQRREIPAATIDGGTNRRSLLLDAWVRTEPVGDDRLSVVIDWTLTDAEGRLVGRPRTSGEVSRVAWDAASPLPYAMLVERAAPGIAALVEDPMSVAVAASEPAARPFYILPVAGAPGDGGPALSRAMNVALRSAKLEVSDHMDEGALVLAGSVRVAPPVQGRQKVEIVWVVRDSNGKDVAKLAQANAVPAGALDGDWGQLASLIAEAAVPGIMDMLRQLPPRAEARPQPGDG